MILSDIEIKRRVKGGLLKVEPFREEDLTPNGIDLRLGEKLMELETGQGVELGSAILKPNTPYIAVTEQWIGMPKDLVAIVSLKSTWARAGFLIPTTVVDAGYSGRLTLAFHTGPKAVEVKRGMKVWHLIFLESYQSTGYKGKYQNSKDLRPADFTNIA